MANDFEVFLPQFFGFDIIVDDTFDFGVLFNLDDR